MDREDLVADLVDSVLAEVERVVGLKADSQAQGHLTDRLQQEFPASDLDPVPSDLDPETTCRALDKDRRG